MRIEYEDPEILVIYKEAGLPVQSARTSQRDVVSLLKNHIALTPAKDAGAAGEGPQAQNRKTAVRHQADDTERVQPEPYLGIIHRLDQPVEGLLVFARTPKSAARLSAQAATKDGMEKAYQAVVCLNSSSYPLAIEGMKREVTLTDWLGRDTGSNTAYVTSGEEKGAKKAELVFRTLWIREGRALLEIRLHTGRHHQIRVQMANAGMPILGDRKYGSGAWPKPGPASEERTSEGKKKWPLCLCAWRLSFLHPATGKKMQFCVEPSFSSSFLLD